MPQEQHGNTDPVLSNSGGGCVGKSTSSQYLLNFIFFPQRDTNIGCLLATPLTKFASSSSDYQYLYKHSNGEPTDLAHVSQAPDLC
jgi:hypothetical protein